MAGEELKDEAYGRGSVRPKMVLRSPGAELYLENGGASPGDDEGSSSETEYRRR